MNELTRPSMKPKPKSEQDGKLINLRYLLQQSIDIFNVYGKEPEQLKNILQGFVMILDPYSSEDISAAFKEWMAESANMPTPADILKIVKRINEGRRDIYSKYLKPTPKADKTPPAKDWDKLSPEGKIEFIHNIKYMPESTHRTYAKVMGYDLDTVNSWIAKNAP